MNSQSATLFGSFCATFGLFLALWGSAAQGVQIYDKDFWLEGVDKKAKIFGGALIETWAEEKVLTTSIDLLATPKSPVLTYQHADTLTKQAGTATGARKSIKGFGDLSDPKDTKSKRNPLSDTGQKAADDWKPAKIEITDDHDDPNKADAKIFVHKFFAGGPPIILDGVWNPKTKEIDKKVELAAADTVWVRLDGSATAGKPTAADAQSNPPSSEHIHSANSVAAVMLEAKRTLSLTRQGFFKAYGKLNAANVLRGSSGEFERASEFGESAASYAHKDPHFVALHDLTTGIAITQSVWHQIIEGSKSFFSLDD